MPVIKVYVKRVPDQPPVLAGEVAAAAGELEFSGGRGVIRGAAMNEIRQLLDLYCGGSMVSDFGMVYEGSTLNSCRITNTGKQSDFTYHE